MKNSFHPGIHNGKNIWPHDSSSPKHFSLDFSPLLFCPIEGKREEEITKRRLETRDKSGEHRSVRDCRCQVIDFAIGERNLTVGRRRESIQDVQRIRKTGGEMHFAWEIADDF